jgi:hypothetical protein
MAQDRLMMDKLKNYKRATSQTQTGCQNFQTKTTHLTPPRHGRARWGLPLPCAISCFGLAGGSSAKLAGGCEVLDVAKKTKENQ